MERHALAALYGAMIGDAAGGPLEFTKAAWTSPEDLERMVEDGLAMKGGGHHRLARGQVTDDGELQMALVHALHGAGRGGQRALTLAAAERYHEWLLSAPVDCGGTCRFAFCQLAVMGVDDVLARVARHSGGSKANGSLMRCLPLALFYCETPEVLPERCRWDGRLSHPNEECVAACTMYCLAVASLVRRPADVEGAIEAAAAWGTANAPVVNAWLAEALREGVGDVTALEGFAKHGFQLAFHHLRLRSSLVEALRDTLHRLGDSDTNACIVGGMVGAREGMCGVPAGCRAAIDAPEVSRPAWLSTRRLERTFKVFWRARPT